MRRSIRPASQLKDTKEEPNANQQSHLHNSYNYVSTISAAQYYSQDGSGQLSFGYAHPGQAAENYRDVTGNQIGGWAFVNPDGKEVRVAYIADSEGFRILSNDLPIAPEPVTDTPEVAAARAQHLAAHAAIQRRTSKETSSQALLVNKTEKDAKDKVPQIKRTRGMSTRGY